MDVKNGELSLDTENEVPSLAFHPPALLITPAETAQNAKFTNFGPIWIERFLKFVWKTLFLWTISLIATLRQSVYLPSRLKGYNCNTETQESAT